MIERLNSIMNTQFEDPEVMWPIDRLRWWCVGEDGEAIFLGFLVEIRCARTELKP